MKQQFMTACDGSVEECISTETILTKETIVAPAEDRRPKAITPGSSPIKKI